MEFNAYELLSKLRGGQPLPESNVGGPVVNPHAKHAQQTSVQKRERIEVRVELEKDIAKLNEEILKLKFENKTLQNDKLDLQNQLREQKLNSDDTIRGLRNDVVNLRKRINSGGGRDASLANNFDGTGSSNRLVIPGRNSALPLTNPAINRQLQYLPPPPGMNQFGQAIEQENQVNNSIKSSGDYNASVWKQEAGSPSGNRSTSPQFTGTTASAMRRNSNFAGPTFSELMRRSAPVYKDFTASLRDTKAFYVATPTVITNANQDPQFAAVRRASIAMHAKLHGLPTSPDPYINVSYPPDEEGQNSNWSNTGNKVEEDVPISMKTVQCKPFA